MTKFSFYKQTFISVLVFFVILTPVKSFSQSTISLKDSTFVVKPEPIELLDINEKFEKESLRLASIEKKIMPHREVHTIDSLYPEYVQFISTQKKEAHKFIKGNPNRQKIDNLISQWKSYYSHFSDWQATLNGFVNKNLGYISSLKFDEKVWNKTLDNAREQKAPEAVLVSVKSTRNKIRVLLNELVNQNKNLLTKESRINNQKTTINLVIADLTKLKNSKEYYLFYQRQPPIWRMDFKNRKNGKFYIGFVKMNTNIFSQLIDYIRENDSKVFLYLFYILLFTFLIIYLRKSFVKYDFNEQDAQLQRAKDIILNHATSSIIFIAAFISYFVFSDVSLMMKDIMMLIVLIVSIPLIKPFLYKRFKSILYFIILIFILNAAKTYLWYSSGFYRIFIFLESFLVFGIIYYYTHPYWVTRKMKMGKFGILLVKSVPILYFLLFISAISNITGYTNLTDITLKIATKSSIITVTFYSVLMIASGLTTGILHSYLSKRKSVSAERKFLIEKKSIKWITIIVLFFWVIFFLKLVDLLDPLQNWLVDFANENQKVGSISFTYGNIFTFILVLAVSFFLTSFISSLVDNGGLDFVKLPKGVPAAISLVIRYFIIAFGFVLALSVLGIDLSKFNLMAGALGLGIGFGLQTIISNFISGIILVFERPILPGDIVEVNSLLGKVTNIGIRASNIKTFDGSEVIVPNNNLISNDLINWTLSDNKKRIEIFIGVAYGTDLNLVLKILKEAALANDQVITEPSPIVIFTDFGDSSLNFRLTFWVHYDRNLEVKSEVSVDINYRLIEHGIEIPFPQQDVHVKDISGLLDQPKPDSSEQENKNKIKPKPESKSKSDVIIEDVELSNKNNPDLRIKPLEEKESDGDENES